MRKAAIEQLWFAEFYNKQMCGLCAQRGVIDTRGIKTPAGFECGGEFWCICPNGRALKKQTKLARPPSGFTLSPKEPDNG